VGGGHETRGWRYRHGGKVASNRADSLRARADLWSFSTLVARVNVVCSFQDAAEEVRITAGLRWLGLFSQEPVVPRAGNLLDTLCARLEKLMAYEPGERDLVMLQHKFIVERADGTEVRSCVVCPQCCCEPDGR
jgi:hypothetical protein